MFKELFSDQNGNLSSKRVFGAGILAIGAVGSVVVGIVSAFSNADLAAAQTAVTTMIYGGLGLLGISTAEFFGKKGK